MGNSSTIKFIRAKLANQYIEHFMILLCTAFWTRFTKSYHNDGGKRNGKR